MNSLNQNLKSSPFASEAAKNDLVKGFHILIQIGGGHGQKGE